MIMRVPQCIQMHESNISKPIPNEIKKTLLCLYHDNNLKLLCDIVLTTDFMKVPEIPKFIAG